LDLGLPSTKLEKAVGKAGLGGEDEIPIGFVKQIYE
jgi:hypothetical protein